MKPRIAFSATSARTSASSISTLMQMALADRDLISLAAGFVDQASLPIETTGSAIDRILADPVEGRRALQYGTTIGDIAFRSLLIGLIEASERVPSGTFGDLLPRVVVTTGSQQLLYLISEVLIDPGDIVLVESPTYFVFLGLLESRGARVIGIQTDDDGMRPDALDETLGNLKAAGELSRVKLIYTVSEHSNPSGISLSGDRRGELVDLARRWSKDHRIFVLEDSAYRGLTYDGVEPPSVWSHDLEGDTVILARTFSKTFSPGIKTGYGVLPTSLVEPVLRLKGSHDFGSANFNQLVLERVILDGGYDRQVKTLVDRYRRKRDVMLQALETHLGGFEGVSWTHPIGGLYVWLTVPEGLDAGVNGPLFSRCVSEGVIYVPGSFSFAEGPEGRPANHARLCFGVPEENVLVEGVRRLSTALAECCAAVA
jgi:2-aminoadipate transaminase